MISYLVFCHTKEKEEETISFSGKASGFVVVPEVFRNIFLGGGQAFLGEAVINDADELGQGKKGSKIKIVGESLILIASNAPSAMPNSVSVVEKFGLFLEAHPLPVKQELLARKVLLAVFREKEANAPFIYLDLTESEEAPLLLSVLSFVFPESDFLLSVPENLSFLLPKLGQPVQPVQPNVNLLSPISQKEGYVNLFSDIIGIKSADPNNPIREKEESQPQAKQKKEKTPKKESPAKEKIKGGPKKTFTPEENRKDAKWNYFFGLLFSVLAIIAPYFFFLFKNEKEDLYFVVYFVLQLFFLFMSFLPICYNTIVENDLTKGFRRFTKISIPTIAVAASFALYFIGKSKGWVGPHLYCFGIAYLCLPPIAPIMLKLFRFYFAKKQASKK